jgi:hypothetical protein
MCPRPRCARAFLFDLCGPWTMCPLDEASLTNMSRHWTADRRCTTTTATHRNLYLPECPVGLKVPKCEIFDLFDFNDFYVMKSLKVGDCRDEI